MSNYFTGSYISSTYQTIANMSSYLTTASASTTYQPLMTCSSTIISSNITLPSTLNVMYIVSSNTNATVTITLPTGMASSNCPVLRFRRVGGIFASTANTFTFVAGNQPIVDYARSNTSYINSSFALMGTSQSFLELQLVVINPSNLGAGSCTITNGSATINVTSMVSGARLCIGTSITVRNASNNTFFTKTLISITSGTGGVGSYVMNSTYNFSQTNTSIVINTSYGWACTDYF